MVVYKNLGLEKVEELEKKIQKFKLFSIISKVFKYIDLIKKKVTPELLKIINKLFNSLIYY